MRETSSALGRETAVLNSRAIDLPVREYYAFCAGRAAAKRSKWLEEARDYSLREKPDMAKLCVKWARGYHHDYLRALRSATS